MRWLVGDVQGCARELDDLLETIRFDRSRDELYCVGDLVNRGPDSLAVLRLWRDLAGKAVLGNHEVYALLAQSGRWPRKHDTLEPLYRAPDRDELLALLRALPALLYLPGDEHACEAWVVHAGLHPRWSDLQEVDTRFRASPHDDDWLESPDVSFVTRVRCCTANGERSRHAGPPEECAPPYFPWDSFYRGDAMVVHGHWAFRGHYRTGHVIGLDSGCVYGGPLTAWCHEEDRIVQVPARK